MYKRELGKVVSEKEHSIIMVESLQRDIEYVRSANQTLQQRLIELEANTKTSERYAGWEIALKDTVTALLRELIQQQQHDIVTMNSMQVNSNSPLLLSSCHDESETVNRLLQLQTIMEQHWEERWTRWNQNYEDLVAGIRFNSTDACSKLEKLEYDLKTLQQDRNQWKHDYEKESKVSP